MVWAIVGAAASSSSMDKLCDKRSCGEFSSAQVGYTKSKLKSKFNVL